jgi:hypothetical protein
MTMRSRELDLQRYDTDKVPHGYLEVYDPVLRPFLDREITLLELGVAKGGSLLLWRDYFPRGTIVGVDKGDPPAWAEREARIRVFQGYQHDPGFLSSVARQTAPDGFDIVIDDASHLAVLTRLGFWHLFDHHLKPGGLYVIEDWGTGYWDDWPDGQRYRPRSRVRSVLLAQLHRWGLARRVGADTHASGMVGFVKELVDEQGAADLTRARMTGIPARSSKFRSLLIAPSLVFVTKR